MLKKNYARRAALVVSLAAGIGLTGAAGAQATPAGPGVSGVILWQKTVGKTDYIMREITIPAHQGTGWHYHNGTLYAVVKHGTLTHYDDDCKVDGRYRQGAYLTEPSGADHVHIGRNEGSTDVVLDVLYVDPAGSPLSVDAPSPGCGIE